MRVFFYVSSMERGPFRKRGQTGGRPCSNCRIKNCSAWPETVLQQWRKPNAGTLLFVQAWRVALFGIVVELARGRDPPGQRPCSNNAGSRTRVFFYFSSLVSGRTDDLFCPSRIRKTMLMFWGRVALRQSIP